MRVASSLLEVLHPVIFVLEAMHVPAAMHTPFLVFRAHIVLLHQLTAPSAAQAISVQIPQVSLNVLLH